MIGTRVLIALVVQFVFAVAQFYPLNKNGDVPVDVVPYLKGQQVPLECISRDIEDGKHRLDDKGNVIYTAFPTCKETGQPLALKFGVNSDINCTITMTDELYHLFQFYIHEDSPFSCRVPISNEENYLEKGGAYVPLAFNFRGEIHESHLDIDNNINVLVVVPKIMNTFLSTVAWSSGTETSRVVIGETLTIQLAIRWSKTFDVAPLGAETAAFHGLEESKEVSTKLSDAYVRGFYKVKDFSTSYVHISLVAVYIVCTIVVSVIGTLLFTVFGKSSRKVGYRPMPDTEEGWAKKD